MARFFVIGSLPNDKEKKAVWPHRPSHNYIISGHVPMLRPKLIVIEIFKHTDQVKSKSEGVLKIPSITFLMA